MADKKISELVPSVLLTGAEELVIVQPISGPKDNKKVTIADIMELSPVLSVNGQTGIVVLDAGDVGAVAPGANISVFTNDAGYINLTTGNSNYWKLAGISTVNNPTVKVGSVLLDSLTFTAGSDRTGIKLKNGSSAINDAFITLFAETTGAGGVVAFDLDLDNENGHGGGARFYDARTIKRGIQYTANYAATFDDRSLADWGNVIRNGYVTTLQANTLIDSAGFDLTLDMQTSGATWFRGTIGSDADVALLSIKAGGANAAVGLSDIILGPNNGSAVAAAGNIFIGQRNYLNISGVTEFSGGRNVIAGFENLNNATTATHNIILGRKNAYNFVTSTAGINYAVVLGYENITNANLTSNGLIDTASVIGAYNLNNTQFTASSLNMVAIGYFNGATPNGGSLFGRGIANGGLHTIMIGQSNFYDATWERYNIAIGDSAGRRSVVGRGNIFIGPLAGADMVGGTPGASGVGNVQFNVAIGDHTLQNGSGNKGTFVGTEAGSTLISGQANAGFGNWSLNRTTGSYNTGLGAFGGYNASLTLTGSRNVFIGYNAGYNTAAIDDTIVLASNWQLASLSNRIYLGNTSQLVVLNAQPANDNALTELLVRDASSGEVKYRTAASILSNSWSLATGATLTGNNVVDTTSAYNLTFDYDTRFESGLNTVLRATVGASTDIAYLRFRHWSVRTLADGYSDVLLGPNNGNASATQAGGNIALGQNNLTSITPAGTWSGTPWFSTFRGDRNIAIGYSVGSSLTGAVSNAATGNVLIGQRVLQAAVAMSYNIIMGYHAGLNANVALSGTNGQSNILLGQYVMQNVTAGSASGNIAIGPSAMVTATSIGSSNVFLGDRVAQTTLTIGSYNTGIGSFAMANMENNTLESVAIGTSTMRFGGGDSNVSVGRAAGWQTRGVGNTSIGLRSTFVSDAVYSGTPTAGTPYTGSNSTFIGYQAGYAIASAAVSNVLVIGNDYQPTLTAGDAYLGGFTNFNLASTLILVNVPANDDALTQVLVRDGTTGQVKYRAAASLGGGGSGDMVLATAQTSTGKKTFSVSGAIAGLNIGANATDPTTTLAAGDMYYQTSVGVRIYSGSAWSTIGSGWAITGSTSLTGAVTIDGAHNITIGTDTGVRTYGFGTGATLNATTKTINIGTAGVSGSTTNINIGSAVAGAVSGVLNLNSPNIGTAANNTTINLWSSNTTTIDFAGAATTLSIGATTGTMNLRNATIVLTAVPATDASFSTSQLLVRDSSGNVDVIAASGGGTTNFLRADGTWTTPAGGSGWAVTGATTITGNTSQTGAFTNTSAFDSFIITPTLKAGVTAPAGLVFTGPAHTNLTASTEIFDVNINLDRTVQFATGAKTLQRAAVFQAPTYASVGATTITDAATVAITGAPKAGTNITMSRSSALYINGGAIGGGGGQAYGLYVVAPTGASLGDFSASFIGGVGTIFRQSAQASTHQMIDIAQSAHTGGNPAIMLVAGGASTSLSSTIEVVDINFNLARTVQWATGAKTLQRAFRIQNPTYAFVGASTITDAYSFHVDGSPVAGTNATITRSWAAGFTGAVGMTIGTDITSAKADTIALFAKNSSDGSANATLAMYLEQAVEAIGTFTPSHKLKIWVNGTEYWVQLDAVV